VGNTRGRVSAPVRVWVNRCSVRAIAPAGCTVVGRPIHFPSRFEIIKFEIPTEMASAERFHSNIGIAIPRLAIYMYTERTRESAESKWNFSFWKCLNFSFRMIADDNRDLNDHAENDLRRQRSNYNGDQLYSNVSMEKNALYAVVISKNKLSISLSR